MESFLKPLGLTSVRDRLEELLRAEGRDPSRPQLLRLRSPEELIRCGIPEVVPARALALLRSSSRHGKHAQPHHRGGWPPRRTR